MSKTQIALLLGGPGDGMKYAVEPNMRIIRIAEMLDDPASALKPVNAASPDELRSRDHHYMIGVLRGAHHEIFHVGLNNASDCAIRMLLAGYRRPKAHDSDANVAEQLVTVLGGRGDGERAVVPSEHDQMIAPGDWDSPHDSYRIVPLVGKDGKTYRVAIRDPLNECPITMLIEGYRQPRSEELENCRFCGARVESPCDEPPTDFCEKALNATYGKRDGRMK